MPASRRIRIFRVKDGVRIPYVIELDHELTVIAEYADVSVSKHVADGRANRDERRNSSVNKLRTTMAKWFSEYTDENPIPGTDPHRQDYWDDLDKLKAEFAGKNQMCPGCKVSQLQQRYREKLRQAGFLDSI